MTSIRKWLLLWLLSGLLLAVLVAAVGVYMRARAEANDLFDYHLRQMALSLPEASYELPPGVGSEELEAGFVVQIWDRSGVRLYFSRPTATLPQFAQLGFTTVSTPDGEWRVFSLAVRNNVVQVAQPMEVRRALAAGMALRTIAPLLALLPVVGVLIWFTVGRGLRPLNRVAGEVGERSPAALQPIAEAGLPDEARPLVIALNDLLGRLARALETQRAFVADAAHELRTPLTALQLQVQLAERARTDPERAAAFARLGEGLRRAGHLVEQLLTLARQEPQAATRALERVALDEVARQVVAEHVLLAEDKSIDLGVSRAEAVAIDGDPDALRVMLGNLVDNAIRYTPAGGKVDVGVASEQGHALLSVADTGPGIPQQDYGRVFDRFYRREGSGVSGSGLGLAIVKNIAERHKAAVTLAPTQGDTGLVVTVRF